MSTRQQAANLILSLLVIILIAITCTENPAGPDISDDLKPKGSITGWVYDAWNRPPMTNASIAQQSLSPSMCSAITSDCKSKYGEKEV